MSRVLDKKTPSSKLRPINIKLDKFNGGVVTLVDESLLAANSVKVAKNLIQTQDGRWSTRWGTAYYGTTIGGTIEGADRYVSSTTSHLVAVVQNGGGTSSVKRSTDNGATWSTCSGGSLTSGYKPYFIQINNYLYIANGHDILLRYDGSTTLLAYTALATPGSPTPTLGSGLTAGTYTNFYQVSAVNTVGETIASSEINQTTNIERNNWKNDPTTADTQYIDLDWADVAGATRYLIYYSDATGQERLLDNVTVSAYHDNGKADTAPTVLAPTADTTTGPKFGPMEISGNRIWGTKDPVNKWRVYWSGTTPAPGNFSPIYDGGYVDLELGGAEQPQRVIHYRDGKGGSFATTLTSDPEGNGSIWQIDLQTITIGNFQYTQPIPVKIVGSTGTIAPLSVVKVRNDIMFFNRRGYFTLGSKAQMLNLLSTDEISANIRPDIRSLTGTALGGVCGHYFDAKVFYSMPTAGSSVNNAVYVNDTERRNWSGPWTFGVERFFEYADTSGNNHLLAVPVSGNKLIEMGSGIQGDLGLPFATQLITGLIPVVAQDRTMFGKIRRAYIELSQPVGPITFTVLGTQKHKSFQGFTPLTIGDTVSNAGFDTFGFDTNFFSDTSITPTAFSRSTIKKYLNIRKKLNNIQFEITTDTFSAAYTLLTLQAKGFVVEGRDPSDWAG